MRKNKPYAIFITATDTHVGKTVATFVLGTLLKRQGYSIGVMKPVQCAGSDAQFLKKQLGLKDKLELINPCYAPEPLSPHLAFRRARKSVDVPKIKRAFKLLSTLYDVLLIEGAGGLMVPLKDNYFVADLIKDLDAEIIIVSRLGLGAINHTLLTIDQARARGIKIKGIAFSDGRGGTKNVAEKTNPQEIKRLRKVNVLGTIPYLNRISEKEVIKKCKGFGIRLPK